VRALLGDNCRHSCHQRLGLAQYPPREDRDPLARRRERRARFRSVQERDPEDALELGHALADGRL